MLADFLLASAHHLLFFGLIAMLAVQSVLLARPLDGAGIRRLVGVDRGYGITAALLLVVGGARVFHGIKGADFYLHNPWFTPSSAASCWRPCCRSCRPWASWAGVVACATSLTGAPRPPRWYACAAWSASNSSWWA